MGDLISIPPACCWSFQKMSCKPDFLSVSAASCHQVFIDRTEPVHGLQWFCSTRKLGGSKPQKSCKHVHLRRRWWWRVVVVIIVGVGLKLSHDLHKLSLGFHHLLYLFLRSVTRRHLLGLENR
jgi:hypothetical protein